MKAFGAFILTLTMGITTLAAAEQSKILIDSVLVSVDGQPITLSDLSAKLKRQVSLREVSSDPETRAVLEAMITDKLVQLEAESRRLNVGDEELKQYMEEVAKRNGMSLEEFEVAIRSEFGDVEKYKEQIRTDILRTKLTATYVRGTTGVTEEEIREYARNNNLIEGNDGNHIILRQILFDPSKHSAVEIQESVKVVMDKLDEGEDFDDLAEEYSDGSESLHGGLLGELAEKDLSPQIFDAVFSLKEGEWSKLIRDDTSFRIFYVEKRITPEENTRVEKLDPEIRERVRKTLEEEKIQTKSANFLKEELIKTHSVDKKV